MPDPFSPADIEQFQQDGLIMLRGGFSREVAVAGRELVWREILSWQNCSTACQPMVHMQRSFSGGCFDAVIGARVRSAIDQLTGTGRAIVHNSSAGGLSFFPVSPDPAAGTSMDPTSSIT